MGATRTEPRERCAWRALTRIALKQQLGAKLARLTEMGRARHQRAHPALIAHAFPNSRGRRELFSKR